MPITRRTILGTLAAAATLPMLPMNAVAQPMRIGVIGAGWLGGTVGRQWVRAGHEVIFSSRHPEELASTVSELGSRASAGTPQEAASSASILLFAVPYDALPQIGRDLRADIAGKVVLDACNPSPGNANPLSKEAHANGVGETSSKYLPGTRLVRAFSAVDATAVETSASGGRKLGVPIAGDDAEAIAIVEQLVRDAGCEPVTLADLSAARAFQRGGPGFRANTSPAELRRLLGVPA